jgi:hypothetical protein
MCEANYNGAPRLSLPITERRVVAKSKADFVSKLGIVEEEADESAFWLEFIEALDQRLSLNFKPAESNELHRLDDEALQLLAITIASRKTARSNDP